MYDFVKLEALYANISSLKKLLKEFSPYAVYELEGGLDVWFLFKKQILQSITLQKELILKAAAENEKLTDEQRQTIKSWELD